MSHEGDLAQASLRELGALTTRTRLASRSGVTGLPLIGWGAAYVAGLPALTLLQGPARVAVVASVYLAAVTLSWLPVGGNIRTGAEGRMRAAWVVVFVATPCLAFAARPASLTHATLMAGALWGLAMCLYGIATEDVGFATVAGLGMVLAGLLGLFEIDHPLAWFGVGAGLPLLALGVRRAARGVRRV